MDLNLLLIEVLEQNVALQNVFDACLKSFIFLVNNLFELGPGDRPRRDPPHDLRRFLLHVHRPAAQRPYHALDLPAVQKAVAVSVEDVEDVAEADVVDLRAVVPRVVVVGVLRDVP